MRQLDTSHEEAEKSHEEAEKRYNHWVEALLLLHKDYRAMTNHIEQLTTAYETQQSSFRSLADGFHRVAEGYNRACSLIHREAEQKRQSTDWRREDGRIENLVKGRARSREGWDIGR